MAPFKEHLFTPGPTHIPLRVFEAMARPTLHHRTETFRKIFRSALDGMKWLVESPNDPIFLASTGTGAMEAALTNTCVAGDTIISVNAGKFGERWKEIGDRLGLTTIEIKAPSGSSPDLHEIEAVVRKHPQAKAFCVQYCESSTAVLHPVPEICAVVRKAAPGMLTVVDAISALATLPISLRELPVDILVGASQKALSLPPGLSMLFLSDRAWEIVDRTPPRSLYFDLRVERSSHSKDTTAWTPAMNIILGLNATIAALREEGLEKTYARHRCASQAAVAGFQALGLEILGGPFAAPSLTAAFTPESVDAEKLRSHMVSHSGIRIAGGQDELKGRIVRIGHMGYMNYFDVLTALSGLEISLRAFGQKITPGSAVSAALAAIGSNGVA